MASVLFQQESYKRGMVLGLTMAEIVLLILFTLLLVLAALLTEKQREQSKLEAQLALVEKEFSAMVNEHIDNPRAFFQELVLAREKAARADRLEQQLQEEKKRNAEMQATLARERAAREAAEHHNGRDQCCAAGRNSRPGLPFQHRSW